MKRQKLHPLSQLIAITNFLKFEKVNESHSTQVKNVAIRPFIIYALIVRPEFILFKESKTVGKFEIIRRNKKNI